MTDAVASVERSSATMMSSRRGERTHVFVDLGEEPADAIRLVVRGHDDSDVWSDHVVFLCARRVAWMLRQPL